MALQPAAGARDLNPHQVETNRNLTERLARVFRLWGYDEVSPPRVERMKTLMAGGGPSPVATLCVLSPTNHWAYAQR